MSFPTALAKSFEEILVGGGDAGCEATVTTPRLGPVRDVELHLSTHLEKLLGSEP